MLHYLGGVVKIILGRQEYLARLVESEWRNVCGRLSFNILSLFSLLPYALCVDELLVVFVVVCCVRAMDLK